MTDEHDDNHWTAQLQDGRLTTPFKHFSVLAIGVVGDDLADGFICPPGKAMMGMKIWANSAQESGEMAHSLGKHIGFRVNKIEIYETKPIEPPGEQPFGYGVEFTPYESEEPPSVEFQKKL